VDLATILKGVQQEARELSAEMPFEAYVERVQQDRRLARLSHQLVYDMILAAGVTVDRSGRRTYELFTDELFGAEDALAQIVEYFQAAARRLDVRKRILLLVGPPGCGKSTLVNTIKQGLEDYTRTREGAVYAIKGCPVYEDPLHLIPRHRRRQLRNVHIEGELCPYCRWLVRNAYRGDIARVPVQRFAFSASEGIGIGTYVATDPGSEDMTRLVGQVDLSLLRASTDRNAARQAYRLDGELNAANRGLADLIEILKMDERFLSVLLALSQEQTIKLAGRGIMYADEAIVAHSNLAEYEAITSEPRAAALLDRLVVVRMGYALAVRDEVRIYEKMLGQSGIETGRLSPLALPAAATFAVLTRLGPGPSGWSLQRKLRYYDGRFVPDLHPEDVAALKKHGGDEGSSGFSPRYVINQLSRTLARADGCVSGAMLLDMLAEGLGQRAGLAEEERESANELLATARSEYDEMVRRAVRRAMIPGFAKAAGVIARDALRELKAWSSGARVDGGLEKLRRLEDALGVPPYIRDDLRRELLGRLETAPAETGDALYRVDARLEEATERLLLPSWRDTAKVIVSQDGRTIGPIKKRLVEELGFPAGCADELIEHARGLSDQPERGRGWFRR
jgi:serine protein kinase